MCSNRIVLVQNNFNYFLKPIIWVIHHRNINDIEFLREYLEFW